LGRQQSGVTFLQRTLSSILVWVSKASGALELAGAISAAMALLREEEDVKPKIGDPTKIASTKHQQYIVRKGGE
jgi:hypothetical protein